PIRGIAQVVERLRDAVRSDRERLAGLYDRGARRALFGRVRQIAPGVEERVHDAAEAAIARLVQRDLREVQRISARLRIRAARTLSAYLEVHERVADALDAVDVHATTDAGAPRRCDGAQLHALPGVAGRVHVRDVVADDIHRRLLREQRTHRR